LTGLSGQLGGTNTWGGSWNTSTGAVTGAIPGDRFVYDVVGVNGSNSEQFSNWDAADKAVLGLTVNNWDLFVYSITFPSNESLAKGIYYY
jgi:hypothetical protein